MGEFEFTFNLDDHEYLRKFAQSQILMLQNFKKAGRGASHIDKDIQGYEILVKEASIETIQAFFSLKRKNRDKLKDNMMVIEELKRIGEFTKIFCILNMLIVLRNQFPRKPGNGFKKKRRKEFQTKTLNPMKTF